MAVTVEYRYAPSWEWWFSIAIATPLIVFTFDVILFSSLCIWSLLASTPAWLDRLAATSVSLWTFIGLLQILPLAGVGVYIFRTAKSVLVFTVTHADTGASMTAEGRRGTRILWERHWTGLVAAKVEYLNRGKGDDAASRCITGQSQDGASHFLFASAHEKFKHFCPTKTQMDQIVAEINRQQNFQWMEPIQPPLPAEKDEIEVSGEWDSAKR